MVNSERRTWATIYITLKWDPEHVFLSVRLHDQLMNTQELTGFLFHCSISCLLRAGHWLFCGLSLCFSSLTHLRGQIVLTFFPLTLLDLLFSPVGIFLFFPPSLTSYSPVFTSTLPFPCSHFPPTFHRFLSCAWFLGHALLTHCDSPALWTACLPTDNHMLPQHSSGKLQNLSSSQLLHINVCLHLPPSSNVQSVGSWELLSIFLR